jgi:hypothetical protein
MRLIIVLFLAFRRVAKRRYSAIAHPFQATKVVYFVCIRKQIIQIFHQPPLNWIDFRKSARVYPPRANAVSRWGSETPHPF